MRRIWRKDGTLWAPPGTPEVEDRLGWLTIADKLLEDLPAIRDFVEQARADGFTDAVLLGMGGSSLAPEVFRRSSPPAEGALRLHVLDSTEPLQIKAVADAIDVATTLFIVSSKSGGTIEPNALLAYFRDLQPDPAHFVAITDPGTSMHRLAETRGLPARSSSATPRSAAATPRCRRSGSCRPRWPASTSRRCSRAPRSRPRTASCPTATRACGSASRSASWRCTAATS